MKLQFRGVTIEAGGRFGDVVDLYRSWLGDPTFVDEDEWAPFAAAEGVSVNIAGPREAVGYGLTMQVKTDDLEGAMAALLRAGAELVDDITVGRHQRHAVLRDPAGVHLVVYCPASN